MTSEFKKQDGNGNGGNGRPCVIRLEIKRTVVIPRDQLEIIRRRSARREQPQQKRKLPR